MLAAIGAKGTNAFTSFEETVYVNDIPSNQLENWLTIEGERFGEIRIVRDFFIRNLKLFTKKRTETWIVTEPNCMRHCWRGLFKNILRKPNNNRNY